MSTGIPAITPPLPVENAWDRHLPPRAAFGWLAAGWRDLSIRPGASLIYGFLIYVVSAGFVALLINFGLDYILFPAFAGFMVIGPLLAIGLYEKSRLIAAGEPVSFARMIFVRPASGGQVLFTGVLLCLLVVFWMRAAVIVYALFFGITPFPGLAHIATMLLTTPTGWAMILVGSVIGSLFAGFSFAVSAFSIPMLLDKRVDALTAMGRSVALVWNNLAVMLVWGAIVLALFLASLATLMLGLVLVFPLLGHGTWHAYQAMARD